jgi:uncharacterized protein YprB with RNaseH-like and TPR domain
MADLAEQLATLRSKIARIDGKYARKYAGALAGPPPKLPEHAETIGTVISGDIVETEHGKHFETEKLYERHRRYGNVDISDLIDLPEDLLDALSGGAIPKCRPDRWAFLDTETTGLMGGSGTYAFLIGVGSIDGSGFRVRQFFMRDHGEERSQLRALTDYLSRFDVLITYNGKTFDQPLLETRYTMARARNPFSRMEHLDLLFGARRLWKLRLENCRLSYLEHQILGVERQGDISGELIPHFYFEYVRTQRALSLVPIFHHNVMDIVTLACLTALVPQTFRDPARVEVRHGADLLGLSRWLVAEGREADALALMRRAIEIGLPDHLVFRTLLDIGLLEKKRKNEDAAIAAFTEIATCRNACRARAFEELAKYYEHSQRSYGMALEMTRSALEIEESAALRTRESRLAKKVARAPRLLSV